MSGQVVNTLKCTDVQIVLHIHRLAFLRKESYGETQKIVFIVETSYC